MKVILAIMIICINLGFPFAVILMNSNNFVTLETDNYIESIKKPDEIAPNRVSGLDFFSGLYSLFSSVIFAMTIYFQAMYFIIPKSTPIISLIVLVIQIISALVVYLLIREG
jgi:hypothetical protein